MMPGGVQSGRSGGVPGRIIGIVAAVLVVLALILPWFSFPGGNTSIWDLDNEYPLAVLMIGAGAGLLIGAGGRRGPALGAIAVGAAGFVAIVFFLADDIGGYDVLWDFISEVGSIGLWVAVLAAAADVVGGIVHAATAGSASPQSGYPYASPAGYPGAVPAGFGTMPQASSPAYPAPPPPATLPGEAPAPPAGRPCPNCGTSLHPAAPYCQVCGFRFYGSPSRTNGLAIASLVLSLLWLYGVGALLAVIFGHVALGQIKRDPSQGGKGMAIAGLILGYLGLVLIVVLVAVVWAFFESVDGSYYRLGMALLLTCPPF